MRQRRNRQAIIIFIALFSLALAACQQPQAQARVHHGQHLAIAPPTPYNNNGVSDDTAPGAANYDTWHVSYSNEALAAAGFGSGAVVTSNGLQFQWPSIAAATDDNWQSAGQVIPVTGTATTLGLLGSASNGAASGTVTITYTDTTTQTATLAFGDWTLNNGTSAPAAGTVTAATMPYRNNGSGKQLVTTDLFFAGIPLTAGKTLQSVTLPTAVQGGQLHVFSVSATPAPTQGPTPTPSPVPSAAFNNESISNDNNTVVANADTWGNSFSNQALAGAGFASGGTALSNGYAFTWPTVTAGTDDNWITNGQVIPLSGTATALGIIGAATNGPSTGNFVVTYTDGTTSSAQLTFSDWTLNGGTAAAAPGDTIAATLAYRNNAGGKQTVNTYLFFATLGLTTGKTPQSVTLPGIVTAGQLHVFAVSLTPASSIAPTPTPGGPTPTPTPPPLAAPNNEGISADANPTVANFDNYHDSYSNDALTAAGFAPGTAVTVSGITFTWPNVAAGADDNWFALGQAIPVTANGTTLGFLGSATNGPSSGTATITYTDGTTQVFTLSFSDWTLNGGTAAALAGNTAAATIGYRNTPGGKQTVATYIFFASVTLTPGKTTANVVLPAAVTQGQLHIFAVAGSAAPTPTPTPGPTNTPTPLPTNTPTPLPTNTPTPLPTLPPRNTPTVGPSPTATPPPITTSDWTTYGVDPGHSFYNSAENILTATNIGGVTQKWLATGAQGINDQPIVVNGALYWGSWDGTFHNTSVYSGQDTWSVNLGQNTTSACDPPTAGVAGTATYATVGGTGVLFVGGGNGAFYALNAGTGAILWSTPLGDTSVGYFIWDSPVVYSGSVYIGVSSFGDCPGTQGELFQLNETTGAVQNIFAVTPPGCHGGGIWGSPTIDTTAGVVYIATGNAGQVCSVPEPDAQAVVALNASNLSLISAWQIPAAQVNNPDSDFGSTPTLFTATIDGVATKLVGVGNKNGYYYAFDRTNVGAGPLWEDQVATGGDCPQCGSGTISPSAFDGTTLYIAGGSTTIGGTACQGSLSAVNPATGAYLWQQCFVDNEGHVLGAVTVIPGVVLVTHGAHVSAYNASTGAILFDFADPTAGALFYSAVTVADGRIYVGNLDGNLYSFG